MAKDALNSEKLNIAVEYINDNDTHDDELDTWLNMLDNYQRSGRII